MAFTSVQDVSVSLACARQLKTSVGRAADDFRPLRDKLLQSLQDLNNAPVSVSPCEDASLFTNHMRLKRGKRLAVLGSTRFSTFTANNGHC